MTQLYDEVAEYSISAGRNSSIVDDLLIWKERYLADIPSISKHTLRAYDAALSTMIDFAKEAVDPGGARKFGIRDIGASFLNSYIIYYIKHLSDYALARGNICEEEHLENLRANKGGLGKNLRKVYVPYRFEKTVGQRLTIIKQMLSYVTANNKEGVDFVRHFSSVASVKVQFRQTEYLNGDELERLIAIAQEWPFVYKKHIGIKQKGREFVAWRNSFIVLLYATTGMRSTEALGIRLEDIKVGRYKVDGEETDAYEIRIVAGKGRKERVVTAPKEALSDHVEYLKNVLPGERSCIGSRSPKSNTPVSYTSIYNYMKHLLTASEIEKRGFHTIRRGVATRMIARGVEIENVALLLGHSSIATTYEFYIKNNPELLAMRLKKSWSKP